MSARAGIAAALCTLPQLVALTDLRHSVAFKAPRRDVPHEAEIGQRSDQSIAGGFDRLMRGFPR
jgi:hypothetical protein